MMRLFIIEWYKLKNHRFFWIGMGLFLLLLSTLLIYFGKFELPINRESDGSMEGDMMSMLIPKNFEEAGFYLMPYLWQNGTFLAGFFKFIPAFLMLFFMSSEFEYRTYRQNIIDGLSISEFFISKIFSLLLFTMLSTLVVGLTVISLAFAYNDMLEINLWQQSEFLLGFFMEVFFMLSFALFLGLLVKRSAVAIIILLMYYYVVEPVIGVVSDHFLGLMISDYLPTNPSRDLIPQPFTRMFTVRMFTQLEELDEMNWGTFGLATAYSFAFLGAAYGILKKRDI